MIAPRKSYAGQVLGWTLAFILSRLVWPVADTTVQDFWKDKGEPYLSAHALGWAVAMVDWFGPFWSGVGLTLLVMLVVEMALAWRRTRAQKAADQEPAFSVPELIELGRECIAVADETFRTQQQIEDAAPRQVHPPGGYKSNDEWSRAHADFGRELNEYQRRTLLKRDRAHGADLMDCMFRLRDLGLTIPVFSDEVPGATGDVRAMLLPHYLTAYARFAGAMGRILKRGDLEAARQSSRDWRQVTERGSVPSGDPPAGV